MTKRFLVLAIACVVLSSQAFTCPNCRDALARSDARWAHGLSLGIVFLLTALVTIVGTFSLALWRTTRGSR